MNITEKFEEIDKRLQQIESILMLQLKNEKLDIQLAALKEKTK